MKKQFVLIATIICAIVTSRAIAQERRKVPLLRHPNSVTLNFPNYVECQSYPGISIGIEYLRHITAIRNTSVAFSYTGLIWAGTQETKEYYAKGYRANIAANLFGVGANYYPIGRSSRLFIETGGLFLFGNLRRIDLYRPGRSYGPVYSYQQNSFFFSPQAHLAFTYKAPHGFTLSLYGDFGPILAADSVSKKGNFGTAGLKIGRSF